MYLYSIILISTVSFFFYLLNTELQMWKGVVYNEEKGEILFFYKLVSSLIPLVSKRIVHVISVPWHLLPSFYEPAYSQF